MIPMGTAILLPDLSLVAWVFALLHTFKQNGLRLLDEEMAEVQIPMAVRLGLKLESWWTPKRILPQKHPITSGGVALVGRTWD
jgi:hypothetical protein